MDETILNLKIDYNKVLVRMGANKYRTKIDTRIETSILEIISLSKRLLQPKYALSFAEKNIKDNNIKNIEVYDITGKLVTQQQVNGNNATIDLTNWHKGIYTLKTYTDTSVKVNKIIVE